MKADLIDEKIDYIQNDINYLKKRLITEAKRLIDTLQEVINKTERTKENGIVLINSLGELQGSATCFDILCCELSHSQKEKGRLINLKESLLLE